MKSILYTLTYDEDVCVHCFCKATKISFFFVLTGAIIKLRFVAHVAPFPRFFKRVALPLNS